MIRRRVVVHCDQPGCSNRIPHPTNPRTAPQTAREARELARKVGWTQDAGHDYCPTHSLPEAA